MVQNFFVNQRKNVKMGLLAFIKKHEDEEMEKVLGLFSLQTGYKVTTLQQYVRELEAVDLL